VSDRQWGTVREDYSNDGNTWGYLTHERARSTAYRWGEDGIAGICDERGILCFSLAVWNGRDRILKERLFGLTGPEGNHGEDVKELYYYLDNTPSHSYMRFLYKYPHREFPYETLYQVNRQRSRLEPEFELLDTGIFEGNRYWDILVEYAKASPKDILIRISVHNRAERAEQLWLVPHLWFRNTWSWNLEPQPKPHIHVKSVRCILADGGGTFGSYSLTTKYESNFLFCDNESNLFSIQGPGAVRKHFKDAFHEYLVNKNTAAVNPDRIGTKACAPLVIALEGHESSMIELRLSEGNTEPAAPFDDFDSILSLRRREADEFYSSIQQDIPLEDDRLIQRQALAGMLWSKQLYCFDVRRWAHGDPVLSRAPLDRATRRNSTWQHMFADDIISMPDKWEYPWFAAWDLAFNAIPLALVDPAFAKSQLLLLTSEWYMHPNGQLPAYEWSFSDVNPPVHAWAAWRVYQIDKASRGGHGDLEFLEKLLHKLALNFTWWVNRKDSEDKNIFQGGFLGLDNIGVFDRNMSLPEGGHLEQSDGTAWMAMYALNLMRISIEIAEFKPYYQDMATKFLDHFLLIAEAMMNVGGGIRLWDEQDEFYYDVLHIPGSAPLPLRVRSLVGLIPLFAVEVLEPETLEKLPDFRRRLEWLFANRPELTTLVSRWLIPGSGERRLLSLLRGHRMKCLLRRMLNEQEFLSPYGVRGLSKFHKDHPYIFRADHEELVVRYTPGNSDSAMFGGNSNWRGPLWFPVNYLIIESLYRFHHYYGDDFKVECPTGSGSFLTLADISHELTRRLCSIFRRDKSGLRPVFGGNSTLQHDPHFRDHLLFHEYFHGENAQGLGASHQTGWTGLIATLLRRAHEEL
jgi:hypothetical protein